MQFWIGAILLGYFLAGVARINTDIRGGRLNTPGYVRDGRMSVAVLALLTWPLRRRFVGIVLTLIYTVLVTAFLMWIVSTFAGLAWQISVVAAIYAFFLLSNLAMMGR